MTETWIRFELGLAAIGAGLAAYGLFDWRGLLTGWGVGTVVSTSLRLREARRAPDERRAS